MSGSHCTAHWEAAFRLKHKNNVLLVDNWRFRFFSFKLIFDVVACKDRMYFGIYLSAEITKLLA